VVAGGSRDHIGTHRVRGVLNAVYNCALKARELDPAMTRAVDVTSATKGVAAARSQAATTTNTARPTLSLRPMGGTAAPPPGHAPQRGDIVVFKFPLDPKEDFIKRIIGLPGDTVRVAGGSVYVDGKALNEPYIAQKPDYPYGPKRVPAGDYFVLGDNRNASYDSHLWSWLPRPDIIGKASVIYWPPRDFQFVSAVTKIGSPPRPAG